MNDWHEDWTNTADPYGGFADPYADSRDAYGGSAAPHGGYADGYGAYADPNAGHAAAHVGYADPYGGATDGYGGSVDPYGGHAAPQQTGYGDPYGGYADPHTAYAGPGTGYADAQTGYADPFDGYAATGADFTYADPHTAYVNSQAVYADPQTGFADPQTGFADPQTDFAVPQGGFADPQGGFVDPDAVFPAPQAGYVDPDALFADPRTPDEGTGAPGSGTPAQPVRIIQHTPSEHDTPEQGTAGPATDPRLPIPVPDGATTPAHGFASPEDDGRSHPRFAHLEGQGIGGGSHLPPRRVRNADNGSRPRRRLRKTVIGVVTVAAVASVSSYAWADSKLNREVDLGKVQDRPSGGKGTNYLIVGSDSRDGLSNDDRKNLHTGTAEGRRTDSMILMHVGAEGTTMMSLPRDSWVTVPGYLRPETGKHVPKGKNKLNAAFSIGGPELLVRTVELNTGLKIDHYAEIGFAGFVNIVDSVGGVNVCLDRDIRDKKSGADLKKGCQTLNGQNALAFVRQRHQEAEGDLGRSQNQQKFLAALARKAGESDTMLSPSKLYSTMEAGLDTLIVDKDTGLENLTSMFRAMKGVSSGNGKRLNVPVSNLALQTSKGSAVQWNESQAKKLFGELKDDRPVTVPPKKAGRR